MNACCITCRRPFKSAGNSKPTENRSAEKKYTQDVARANGSIYALKQFIEAGGFRGETGKSNRLRIEAAKDEITRLSFAIVNRSLLWKIYRRADKGASYATKGVIAECEQTKKAA